MRDLFHRLRHIFGLHEGWKSRAWIESWMNNNHCRVQEEVIVRRCNYCDLLEIVQRNPEIDLQRIDIEKIIFENDQLKRKYNFLN